MVPATLRRERERHTMLHRQSDSNSRGFYRDGRYATIADVVNHYNTDLALGLTRAQKVMLVEYVKSL
jgi:hypothetical protein